MNGLDSAVASLLAAQADILMDAMRPAGGTTTGTTTAQAGTSQLSVDTPAAAAAGPQSALGPAGPSAQTALSSVALTLDAISRFGGGATPPVLGMAPLWPGVPRPMVAAGTFDDMNGLLFSSDSPTAATATATATQAAPPLPAAVLAATLANVVDESGLFYESHLAQWAAGQRPLALFEDEPQADIDGFSTSLPFDSPTAAPRAAAWIDATPDGQGFIDDPLDPLRAVPLPQTPQQAAALAESVRDMPAAVFSSSAGASGAATAAQHAQDTAVQASIAAGIHPATIALVRQQLDLLATEQFRWSGEAWPGALLEWQIEPEERDARSQDGVGATDQAWRTRVTISLPMLGAVDADLILTGNQLVVRVKASADGGARLFADGEHFRQQLEAAGIELAGFSVRPLDESGDAAGKVHSAAALRAYGSTGPAFGGSGS